jgi:hypothetical protein
MGEWLVNWTPPAAEMRKIRIGAVHDYLAGRGWAQKAGDRPGFRYYVHGRRKLKDGRPVHYYLVDVTESDRDGIDYPLAILGFIEAQSLYQGVHPYDIFNELKAASGTPAGEPVQSAAG